MSRIAQFPYNRGVMNRGMIDFPKGYIHVTRLDKNVYDLVDQLQPLEIPDKKRFGTLNAQEFSRLSCLLLENGGLEPEGVSGSNC